MWYETSKSNREKRIRRIQHQCVWIRSSSNTKCFTEYTVVKRTA